MQVYKFTEKNGFDFLNNGIYANFKKSKKERDLNSLATAFDAQCKNSLSLRGRTKDTKNTMYGINMN